MRSWIVKFSLNTALGLCCSDIIEAMVGSFGYDAQDRIFPADPEI